MPLIHRISSADARLVLNQLVALLQDSVEGGASVGFLLPLSNDTNEQYWLETLEEVESGDRILIVAKEGNEIIGSVQLDLAKKQNGLHRAEVQKLLVHTSHRNRGNARLLMRSAEEQARQLNRTLLVLDTLQGGAAEKLYQSCGYTRVGVIPDYARITDGSLQPTVIFYKLLTY